MVQISTGMELGNRAKGVLPKIGVMILNRDGRAWLEPLYQSLREQRYRNVKVYLIDNASSDDSVGVTLRCYPEVSVLRLSENAGYCMAYNLTMPYAFEDGCEWVVWSNNDILLEPDCLLELARTASQSDKIGVIGPAFYAWEGAEPNYYMKGKHPAAIPAMLGGSRKAIDVDWVEGSFLMVRAECLRDVGWLDPYLFFYWEETDFCRRALTKGWRVVLAARAIARHYAGGWSLGSGTNADTANGLKARNQYVFTLADPAHSFSANVFRCIHLFAVLLKAARVRSLGGVLHEIDSFVRVMADIREVKKKWRRDKRGINPEATTAGYAHIVVEAIRRSS